MIIKHPNPILKKVCEPIDFALDQGVINELRDEFLALGDGIALGLSAPQIGHAKRCFAMLTKEDGLYMVCNPVIEHYSDQVIDGLEGCLSMPWLNNVKIMRHLGVVGHFFTASGERHEFHFHSLEARVFQHEFDHLNGITIDQRRRGSNGV